MRAVLCTGVSNPRSTHAAGSGGEVPRGVESAARAPGARSVRLGLGATLQGTADGATMALGSDTLILGQLLIDPSGNETLSIWVNPDVSGGIPGLGTASTSLSEQAGSLDSGIARVGIQSYSSDNQGGVVDAFVVSDATDPNQAFADVSGVLVVPEPSSTLLTLLASLGLLRRRR